jgi:hypothetical protein
MNQKFKMQLILFSLALFFAASAGSAWALTASNTRIINNASLSYNDGTSNITVNAVPVMVTVTLLPGQPTVSPGPDQSTAYTGANTPLINTFTITASNTNGPDSYSLTPAIIATINATGSSVLLTSPSSPVTLGATVTLSGSTATVLVVPADGNNDSAVNGIAVNDWVVVNNDTANPRQVSAISDNAAGTSTITVAPALASGIPGAGLLVGEQQTVTVTVQSGTITTVGSSIVITKQLTIASMTDPTMTATAGPITDTYFSGLATLRKYVRNITTPAAGGTIYSYPAAGTDYYLTGITAQPGEVLEYILVAENSGTGNVTAAAINDSLPTTYVSLATGAYAGSTDITYFNESGIASYLTSGAGDDTATYASPTLTVNVGTGATSAAGGTIASGATVRVLYRVTVNP